MSGRSCGPLAFICLLPLSVSVVGRARPLASAGSLRPAAGSPSKAQTARVRQHPLTAEAFVGLHNFFLLATPPGGRFQGAGNNFADNCSSGRQLNLFLSQRIDRCKLRVAKPRTVAVRGPRAPPRDHGASRRHAGEAGRAAATGQACFPRRSLVWPMGPGTKFSKVREQFYANQRGRPS